MGDTRYDLGKEMIFVTAAKAAQFPSLRNLLFTNPHLAKIRGSLATIWAVFLPTKIWYNRNKIYNRNWFFWYNRKNL